MYLVKIINKIMRNIAKRTYVLKMKWFAYNTKFVIIVIVFMFSCKSNHKMLNCS